MEFQIHGIATPLIALILQVECNIIHSGGLDVSLPYPLPCHGNSEPLTEEWLEHLPTFAVYRCFAMNMLGRVVRTVAFKKMAVMRAVPVRSLQDFGGVTTSKPKMPKMVKDDDIPDIPLAEECADLIEVSEVISDELRDLIKAGRLPENLGKAMIADNTARMNWTKEILRRRMKKEELRLAKEKESEQEGEKERQGQHV